MHGKALMIVLLSVSIILGGCSGLTGTAINTQDKYPSKPITLIVQYVAGGSTDLLARSMEKTSKKYLGQPLVVVNKPGGTGIVAWNELCETQPDGYTLGMTSNNVILQTLYGPTRYNYPTALEPIAQIAVSPVVVAVRADSPWQSITDVVAYAKQHPGEIKFAHPGLGGPPHIVGEMFAQQTGIKIEQVPFLGTAESVAATLGGHVQLMFASSPSDIKELVRSGKLRALAISGEKRLSQRNLTNYHRIREKG